MRASRHEDTGKGGAWRSPCRSAAPCLPEAAPDLGAPLPAAPGHGGVPAGVAGAAGDPAEGTPRLGGAVLQMKDSLVNLQNGIRSRDYSSESEDKRSRYH